jgi:WD40 repeat protein
LAAAVPEGGQLSFRVIDVDTGRERELDRRPLTEDYVPVLALSADGGRLVVASGVGPPGLTVWDVDAGRRRDLPDPDVQPGDQDLSICYRLLLTADGRRAAALQSYRGATRIRVWDADAGGPPTVLDPQALPLPLAFSPNGRTLARMTKDGIVLTPLAGGAAVTLAVPRDRAVWVNDLAVSPTRPLLAAALLGKGSLVGFWDTASGQFLGDVPLSGGMVAHVAFSPDGERLAATVILRPGGEQVHYLRVADRAEEFRHPTPGGGPSKMLVWSADGRRLATAVEKDAVRVWEPAWVTAGDSRPGGHAVPTELAFSPDGRWQAVGGWDGTEDGPATVRLTGLGSGRARELPAPDRTGRLVFRPDGRQLAVVARTAAVLWDAETGGELARQSPPAGGEFVSAAFGPAGGLLALDRAGGLWDVGGGRVAWMLPPDAGEARLSPDGRWLVTGIGGKPEAVAMYDAATHSKLRTLQPTGTDEVIDQPRFSPDGRWLFTLTPPARLATYTRPWASLWDATTGAKRHDLTGEAHAACSAFDPAGEVLAVGHEDGAVRVWRVETGEELFRWRPAGTKPVRRLAFTADGADLVAVVEGSADLPVLRLGVLRRELAAIGLGW